MYGLKLKEPIRMLVFTLDQFSHYYNKSETLLRVTLYFGDNKSETFQLQKLRISNTIEDKIITYSGSLRSVQCSVRELFAEMFHSNL